MLNKYYCKWCGLHFPSVQVMASSRCSKNPQQGNHHELYEGGEKSQYTCKYCGFKFPSIMIMTSAYCPKHPRKARHEPAL